MGFADHAEAVAMGKLGGQKRAKVLSACRRSAIARMGGHAKAGTLRRSRRRKVATAVQVGGVVEASS